MHYKITLLLILLCTVCSAQQTTSAQMIEGKREMKVVEQAPKISEAALSYISSCQSSTPLSGGAGAPPSLAILNFRDLVATQPITIIRLDSTISVADKSGSKGEPPLRLTEITLVHLENSKVRVFAHTEASGLLIEFRKPSEDAEKLLLAVIKTTQEAQSK